MRHAQNGLTGFCRQQQFGLGKRLGESLVEVQQPRFVFLQQFGIDQMGDQSGKHRFFGLFRRVGGMEPRQSLRE